jgi:hypothetical protein
MKCTEGIMHRFGLRVAEHTERNCKFESPCLNWKMQALALHTSPYCNSTEKDAKGTAMLSLPFFLLLDAKKDELLRWSESISACVRNPLQSLCDRAIRDVSAMIQADQFITSYSSHNVEATQRNVENKYGCSAHFTIEGKLSAGPSTRPVVCSASHDFGVPDQCTDIMYLLIDDVLHISEERVERYYRVWCRPEAAMLVSSSITRSFDAAGYVEKVSLHPADGTCRSLKLASCFI